MVSPLASHLPWEETVSFYLCPTIACLVCHRLNTSPVYIPMVSLLASHLPGLPLEETVSFYLCPTIACLVCHRLNTFPVYIPIVSPLASHLPGLPWEETVSFYLCPTIACLVCHRLNTSPVYIPMVSTRLAPSQAPRPSALFIWMWSLARPQTLLENRGRAL